MPGTTRLRQSTPERWAVSGGTIESSAPAIDSMLVPDGVGMRESCARNAEPARTWCAARNQRAAAVNGWGPPNIQGLVERLGFFGADVVVVVAGEPELERGLIRAGLPLPVGGSLLLVGRKSGITA